MKHNAIWIKAPVPAANPIFYRNIEAVKDLKHAQLKISAIGMYTAYINGQRVGNEIFTPYWTEYKKRVQYQTYDVTNMLKSKNELCILCAEGWAVGNFGYENLNHYASNHISIIYELELTYEDSTVSVVRSDTSTLVKTSHIMYSQIYNGETIDYCAECEFLGNAKPSSVNTMLVPQQGEPVKEQDRLRAERLIITPKGERVIDFGQNLSGYVEIRANGSRGDVISISHAEVLDKDGNFYTENLRAAKQKMTYVLSGNGTEILKPYFSWQGFRFIRINEFPSDIDITDFTAVAVHSDIARTGYFDCGNEKINKLYSNIIWGQKSNYIDVPTDCPQRNERLGWTGDAQVFARTAAINFDVEKFYSKWLVDLALGQQPDGGVKGIVPMTAVTQQPKLSAGWGDAAVICPWEIYLAYGNDEILRNQFNSIKAWIDYMHTAGSVEYLWIGGDHYGDWLASEGDGYEGSTSHDFIASAYFAYSTSLFIKAGKILGMNMHEYELLHKLLKAAFKRRFIKNGVPEEKTQTAYALAIQFDLCDIEKTGAGLVNMIEQNGMRLSTGFIGTPYLLHALTKAGRTDIAYELLFQEHSPSWLYSVNHGATTVWEHWDGIKKDGSFCAPDMNSFNHYAFGAVYDWIFGVAAGVTVLDDGAGYSHIRIEPHPDKRMGYINASIKTKVGKLSVKWCYDGDNVRYELEVPNGATAEVYFPDGSYGSLGYGRYEF